MDENRTQELYELLERAVGAFEQAAAYMTEQHELLKAQRALLEMQAGAAQTGELTLRLVLEDGTALAEALIDPINKTAKNLGYASVFRVEEALRDV